MCDQISPVATAAKHVKALIAPHDFIASFGFPSFGLRYQNV
jgi:hypothetical protein